MTAESTQLGVVDLFSDLDGDVQEKALAAVEDLVEAQEPEPILTEVTNVAPGFTAYWHRYRDAVNKAAAELDNVILGSSELFIGKYRAGQVIGAESLGHATREEIRNCMFARAESEFAPPGGKLKIDRDPIYEEVGEKCGFRHNEEEFDPDAIWLAIERRYGGEAGKALGLRQTAEALVSAFNLRNNLPVRKGNRLELEKHVWCEKRFKGGHELSYSTHEAVNKANEALATFCEWAGDSKTAEGLRIKGRTSWYGQEIVSRARQDFGGIGVVTYLQKFVYELYGDLGTQFQAFIGLHGREALKERG